MSYLVGEKKTYFWHGEKYIFERTDNGNWKCIHQDTKIIPYSIVEELKALA